MANNTFNTIYSHVSAVPEFSFQDICNKHCNDSAAHAVYKLGVSLYSAVHKSTDTMFRYSWLVPNIVEMQFYMFLVCVD